MGFADSFKIPVSDSQAYRLFGTSSVVIVVKSIAELIVPHVLSFNRTKHEKMWVVSVGGARSTQAVAQTNPLQLITA